MTEAILNIEGAVCAPPLTHNEQIVMGHGAGGRMSHQLIQKAFLSAFDNRLCGQAMTRRGSNLVFMKPWQSVPIVMWCLPFSSPAGISAGWRCVAL
jgi:hypothetical protein